MTLKKGKRYAVRIGYTHQGQKEEFNQMGLKTIAAAKSALRNVEEKIENYDHGLIGNKKITVREYFLNFVEEKVTTGSWNNTSKQAYESLFANHLLPVCGDTSISKIDRLHYQKFINDKLTIEKLSPETVRSINNAFMSFLNHTVNAGVLERNRLKEFVLTSENMSVRKNI